MYIFKSRFNCLVNGKQNQYDLCHDMFTKWNYKLTIRYLYLKTYRNPSEQLFPNRWPLSYPNSNKNVKTYTRLKQHKKRLQNIKQTEPQQKYRLGTVSNMKLMDCLNPFYKAITTPSFSALVHNI